MYVDHYEGDPNGCSEHCSANNAHKGDVPADAPECCPECGGSIKPCWPVCTEHERNRAYEPWEGLTGAQEYYDWEY